MEPTLFKGTEESNYISLQMPLCSAVFLGLGCVSSLTLTVYKPTLFPLNKGRTAASPGGPRGDQRQNPRQQLCGQSLPPSRRKSLQTTCEFKPLMKDLFDQLIKGGRGEIPPFLCHELLLGSSIRSYSPRVQHPYRKHPPNRAVRDDCTAGMDYKGARGVPARRG